ncbi:protein of unknown function [Rhodovastum atsumiense]|nr:protein of unknown function [Rhodovastum atsumiense]
MAGLRWRIALRLSALHDRVPRALPLVEVQEAKPPGGVRGNAPPGGFGSWRVSCGE